MPSLTSAREPTPAVAAVDRLLRAAVDRRASDLHLDPIEDGLRVRARVDGVLLDLETLPPEVAERVIGRLKSLAGLLAYRTDVPQEGRIAADRSPCNAEVRVATYPTLLGERAALRFDAPHADDPVLDALGLPAEAVDGLREALRRPDGVLLLTGPSGSGKTTTLYSCLRDVAQSANGRSVLTLEDPVERRIPGIVQTEISEAAGLSFARALRSLLRQDPDVLLVGEIRDRETAAIVLEAGLTGHLVASTVHAGTAPAVFARLLELGVEPFVLTTAVRGVLAQRLLRKTCESCLGARCSACGDTGYRGRVVAAEWLPMSSVLRDAVLARGDGRRLEDAAREFPHDDLVSSAKQLVRRGLTTAEEVRRVLGNC